MHLSHSGFDCCLFYGGASDVVDSLLIVTAIVGFCNCSMICCVLLCVQSSFANNSMGKRELVALLCMSESIRCSPLSFGQCIYKVWLEICIDKL